MIHIPHLETDVTTRCQLSCVACNHCVPMWRLVGPREADPRQVEQDLNRLAKFVHAEYWGALGGDPLLHPALVDILRIARRSGIANAIEVWTNGVLLQQMPSEFWQECDVLVLSLYPNLPMDVEWVTQRCKEDHVRLTVRSVMTDFFALLEKTPTEGDATRRKFHSCFFRGFSRAVNEGHLFTCCVSPQLPYLLQEKNYGADGLAITETLTEEAVAAFLDRTEPLGCCSICAGSPAPVVRHQQQRNVAEWLKASAGR